MAFAIRCDPEEGSKGGHLGEWVRVRKIRGGGGGNEKRERGGETYLVLIPTLPWPGVYTKRKPPESITGWERVRPNASTIFRGYSHHHLPLAFISAHITKYLVELEKEAER